MCLTPKDIIDAMRRAHIKILDSVDYLNELDSRMGDGEHGANIRKSFSMVNEKLGQWDSPDKSDLLQTIGKTFLSSGGGTATTLFGVFFLYAGRHAAKFNDDWSAQHIAEIVNVAYVALQKRSTAQLGDKTLIDALEPAVRTFIAMTESGHSMQACLEGSAQASEEGAANTSNMIARKGRGLYVGERGLGILDPGAVSVSLILRSWADNHDKVQGLETSKADYETRRQDSDKASTIRSGR